MPWEFDQPEQAVAVGDVKGDLEALDVVLRAASLVDDVAHDNRAVTALGRVECA